MSLFLANDPFSVGILREQVPDPHGEIAVAVLRHLLRHHVVTKLQIHQAMVDATDAHGMRLFTEFLSPTPQPIETEGDE